MTVMTLNVNGKNVTVDCDPTTPLLWVLRDILNLTGTKYGCGVEICKACSVWLDGSAEKTCLLQVKEVLAKKIVTIEGVSATPGGRQIQQAWVDKQVPQCGFCQSGVIMFASRLVSGSSAPSDAQIDSAIGNICVCGTYPRMKDAIKYAWTLKGKV